jgi:hypothetical protein
VVQEVPDAGPVPVRRPVERRHAIPLEKARAAMEADAAEVAEMHVQHAMAP